MLMNPSGNSGLRWNKSSHSAAGNACVEVAVDNHVVYVRHSQHPDWGTLRFTIREWSAFLAGARAGEFTTKEE